MPLVCNMLRELIQTAGIPLLVAGKFIVHGLVVMSVHFVDAAMLRGRLTFISRDVASTAMRGY